MLTQLIVFQKATEITNLEMLDGQQKENRLSIVELHIGCNSVVERFA